MSRAGLTTCVSYAVYANAIPMALISRRYARWAAMPVLAPRHVACRAAAPSVPRAQVKDVVLHGFPTSSVSFLARCLI